MEPNWNVWSDRSHFQQVWNHRHANQPSAQVKAQWNEWALDWTRELDESKERRQRSDARVAATVRYLQSKGLLRQTDQVIDVGCGPGRFVAQFAKCAGYVVGTDISGRMLEYAGQYAREAGVENVGFVEADFKKADLDKLGWRNRFDLVFSSITPAIGGPDGLDRLNRISRGWCFNSCFVHDSDALEDAMAWNILGETPRSRKAGPRMHLHWFYAMFNLLLLDGYYPETTYYTEHKQQRAQVNEALARTYSERLEQDYGRPAEKALRSVREYLERSADPDGTVSWDTQCKYGWMLWNAMERNL